MDFQAVEGNLRDSFRVLAAGRQTGDVRELPGVSIASVGVSFQMFNAAFLSSAVEGRKELEGRLAIAREYFALRGIPWSFWLCESWLPTALRRRLASSFDAFGLRLASEMPGMVAEPVEPARNPLPRIEVLPATNARTLEHFRVIGSTCFRVPPDWFAEVFNERSPAHADFPCWVAYSDGIPVATAATVTLQGVTGVYNVATVPSQRARGFGEAITRFAIEQGLTKQSGNRVILQSTAQGLSLYERIGFRAVTRILVFNSR
jgi:hypothetical protein